MHKYFIGTMYTYLACSCGSGSESHGAFRALTRGYNHWASGHLNQLEVNTSHPEYCHVRASITPSMKPGRYNVFLVLNSNGPATCIQKATCECAAGSVISVFFFWST